MRAAQPRGWRTAGPGVDVWTAVGLLLPPFLPQEVPGPYGPKVGMPLPLRGRGARGALPGRVLLRHGQTGQGSGKYLESLCQARGSSRTRAEPLQCPPASASSFLSSPAVTSTGHTGTQHPFNTGLGNDVTVAVVTSPLPICVHTMAPVWDRDGGDVSAQLSGEHRDSCGGYGTGDLEKVGTW